jgi:hypothetical protein
MVTSRPWRGPFLAALLFGVATGAAATFTHYVPGGVLVVPQQPYPADCWVDVRTFHSMRYGEVPYCRENLRYRPGAFECFEVVDRVCAIVTADAQLVDARTPVQRRRIVCPAGPRPPVCRRLDLR